jgi:hypothetical protein
MSFLCKKEKAEQADNPLLYIMGLNRNKLKRNLLSSAQHFVLLERKLAQG